MVSLDFRRQLEGFGLTTANILYRLPDHPAILQNYIWQQHDLHPDFPELTKFLDFWTPRARRPASLGDGSPLPPDQAGRVPGGRRGVSAELTCRRVRERKRIRRNRRSFQELAGLQHFRLERTVINEMERGPARIAELLDLERVDRLTVGYVSPDKAEGRDFLQLIPKLVD